MPWSAPFTFAQDLGQVDALTMIQSNYGSPGNLELIARVRDTLQFFWRDSGPAFHWNGPYQIATGAAATPPSSRAASATRATSNSSTPRLAAASASCGATTTTPPRPGAHPSPSPRTSARSTPSP
ncbi:hypothetical protein ACFQ1I_27110 [Kitasatospora arboriphila]